MARSADLVGFLLTLSITGLFFSPSEAITFKVDLNGSNEAFAVAAVNKASGSKTCVPCSESNGCACGSVGDNVKASLYMTGVCNGSYIMYYTFKAITLNDSDSVIKAHVHKGLPTEQSGAHIVTLFDDGFDNVTFKAKKSAGGLCDVEPSAFDEVTRNPYGYYLNLHTDLHQKGAMRGQLIRVDEEPTELIIWPIPTGALAVKSNDSSSTSPSAVRWYGLISFSSDMQTFNHSFQLINLGANVTITKVQIIDGASGPEVWDLSPSFNRTQLALSGFTWGWKLPVPNPTIASAIYANPTKYYLKFVTSSLVEGELSSHRPSTARHLDRTVVRTGVKLGSSNLGKDLGAMQTDPDDWPKWGGTGIDRQGNSLCEMQCLRFGHLSYSSVRCGAHVKNGT